MGMNMFGIEGGEGGVDSLGVCFQHGLEAIVDAL